MKLVDFKAHQFRNLEGVDIKFHPRANYFFGANGQGKTNVLEAISFLLNGGSFRTHQLDQLLKSVENSEEISAHVRATVVRNGLESHVEASLIPGAKRILVNGKRVALGDLGSSFPVIIFSPESLAAIKEGPEHRRGLLNELTVSHDPQNASLINQYARALKTRNKILRDFHRNSHKGSGGGQTTSHIRPLLESLNRSFYGLGSELIYKRLEALNAFKPLFIETASLILRIPVDISVEYVSSIPNIDGKNPFELHDALQQRGEELFLAELSSGTSLVGPHKHDLRVLFDGHDARFFCSQGQQRALILGFKIAQIVYHRRVQNSAPILLLDDVLSELDSERKRYLIEFLKSSDSQTFLTSTELPSEWMPGQEGELFAFEVCEGRVRKA